jgi:3-keto-5-aminohexanoate cleavage enzyme
VSTEPTANGRADRPLVIEAAISPFRPDAPVADATGVIEESIACIRAGSAIIHHHHDQRLARDEAIGCMIDTCRSILRECPGARLYPGILSGRTPAEHMAHLVPMAEAGVLGMAPLDPGAAVPYDLDEYGVPTGHGWVWNPFSNARQVAAAMLDHSVPLAIGVYEPVQLRWALAMEAAGQLAPGTMVKLYFGGSRSLFTPGRRALNFGLPPTPRALDVYLSMMDGSRLAWMVGVMGDDVLDLPLARHALERGGHLRVGIEDLGDPTRTNNVATVDRAVALAEQVGRPVAPLGDALAVLRGDG